MPTTAPVTSSSPRPTRATGRSCSTPRRVAIVTNVEADHLDHYGTPTRSRPRSWPSPSGSSRAAGSSPAPTTPEHAGSPRRPGAPGVNVWTYGESTDADVRIEDLQLRGATSSFQLVSRGRRLGRVDLRVLGRHNALNAAAAFSAGLLLGYHESDLRRGLERFSGTRRRFEFKGASGGVRVYDSYDHHPTEIRAVLTAAREVVGDGRLVVAFQPHRYSRTAALHDDFGAALGLADEVVVMEVYSAGEDPIPGVSGASVAAAVPLPPERATFQPSWSAVAGELARRARPGDIVLTLGAGDVTMIGPRSSAR
jgi:UDP-N-acetylmuramate--alanine ligase